MRPNACAEGLLIYTVHTQVDADDEDDEHIDLSTLASHKLRWNPDDGVANANKRRDDPEDYKVVDPLLVRSELLCFACDELAICIRRDKLQCKNACWPKS